MTRDDVIRMARDAGFFFHDAGHAPILHTNPLRYSEKCFERFATMAADRERAKLLTELEQAREQALTAEKWRGLATARFGDGRTVQEIQREAAQAERDVILVLIEIGLGLDFEAALKEAVGTPDEEAKRIDLEKLRSNNEALTDLLKVVRARGRA